VATRPEMQIAKGSIDRRGRARGQLLPKPAPPLISVPIHVPNLGALPDAGGHSHQGVPERPEKGAKGMPPATADRIKNIVLVHGGFVDGSGWLGVYRGLKQQGFSVSVVQNPTSSLADDVRVTRLTLAQQDGPVILVGHSYGGAVITGAGNDPIVAGLVYVAAFAPDTGESVASLIKDPPPGASVPPILPPQDGYLFLDKAKFAASFAADVDAELAAFMADAQVPWGLEALQGAVSQPAWKSKPSWYLLTTEDRMIPPAAQRAMSGRAGSTVTEVRASHSVYVSRPDAVVNLIAEAAKRAHQAVGTAV